MAAINKPLSVLTSNRPQLHEVTRRSANYHPSVWGDHFLAYASHEKKAEAQEWQEHQQLKEKVKNMLVEAPCTSSQKMELINKIQRLGVSYQFEKEIEATLQLIFNTHYEFNAEKYENDLYTVSLRFRLLRQHGYHAPCGVFENFTGCDGKFKESLTDNVQAILALYEASHLRVHGEKILDEALIFTTSYLKSLLPNLTDPLRSQVNEALKRPIYKRLTRIEARRYISIYEVDETHDIVLLKFAKLDFNMLQKEHQRELGNLTRWWKGLNVPKNLPFARDRLVECYFWMLGVYFEPQYSFARRFLLKVIAMTSLIDDIYDVYGTLDELHLFTDAIQRWDAGVVNELPEYMRVCYLALLNVYAEMEKELAVKGESYRISYAKYEMKKLVGAYYEEAKWFYNRCTPKFEEYMKVALITGAYMMLSTTSLVGMPEDFVTKEALDWVCKEPLIIRAASVICRLMDDMAGHEFEKQRGHLDSAVESYMKQYEKSKEETFNEFHERVNNAWKDINQECLKPTVFPMPILIRVVNLARVIDLLYKDGDTYTHSTTELKAAITSVLIDPIPYESPK
ncbi:PREDICTED: (-)-germacrene D synthase-like isoform X1 [Ipomoea nil]|uniref:(-)-germacrene D synthase-like isoform X1 n=1 Tax=Ipomoea nil TaxID=35883 RepID=UPI0009014FDE|nr:PREDICTED: (-)-germacrene D synthase-like isoform X1 [Ipomoea nil]